jgi:thioredoxin reductase
MNDNNLEMNKLAINIKKDLEILAYPSKSWILPQTYNDKHTYDVIIIGGGQCGLATAFGLMKEQVTNILVLDENNIEKEGPWITYARMITLRTSKYLTGIDYGIPSLTFQAYYEAKYGVKEWESLDKIPKEEWMEYLIWYKKILNIPVNNNTKIIDIKPLFYNDKHIFKLISENDEVYFSRKIVLATGIQGGGEWHIPSFIKESLPKHLYAHTSELIDFDKLKNKKIAILGGGASAFDNAQHALEQGVGEVHVFVRREELPKINLIRFMEFSGFLNHFADLDDATKYAGIKYFMLYNQPPTNDTFSRASKFSNFYLHTSSPWEKIIVSEDKTKGCIFTPKGNQGYFDYFIISTGLITDTKLRPELKSIHNNILTWKNKFIIGLEDKDRNFLLDDHPYLGPSFEYQSRNNINVPYII